MSKKVLVLSGILLIVVCFAAIYYFGRTNTITCSIMGQGSGNADDYEVVISSDENAVKFTEKHIDDNKLIVNIQSVNEGVADIEITGPEKFSEFYFVYVHPLGIITEGGYLGRMNGGIAIPACVTAYLLILLAYCITKYRSDVKESLYQYKNIGDLGIIVFLTVTLITMIPNITNYSGIESAARAALSTASGFTWITFPLAAVVSVLVTLSNIDLMRKEGRNWRNMLGCILGILLLASTIFPWLLGEYLQRTTLVDVHNENALPLYIEMMAEDTISAMAAYLECVLIGTIIIAVRAARHIPAFNKDYILILGCQVRKDGTPTPLLQGRADRAVDFAEMQKKETGKDIVFVPSGGRGSDEVISEGKSVAEYLKSRGIPEEKIITEAESKNTYENFRNSIELIRNREAAAGSKDDPQIAFSTTNYHVLRSGLIALSQGVKAEGIGSPTKSYFWINAFIREFIATLYSERKKHIAIVLILMAVTALMVGIVYIASNH